MHSTYCNTTFQQFRFIFCNIKKKSSFRYCTRSTSITIYLNCIFVYRFFFNFLYLFFIQMYLYLYINNSFLFFIFLFDYAMEIGIRNHGFICYKFGKVINCTEKFAGNAVSGLYKMNK